MSFDKFVFILILVKQLADKVKVITRYQLFGSCPFQKCIIYACFASALLHLWALVGTAVNKKRFASQQIWLGAYKCKY